MKQHDGTAIAIAWPYFMGKQAGSWYDPVMQLLNINRNFHYRVGHAALILINNVGKCFYFDCGRYHTPYQKGRIRDVTTDHDIGLQTLAVCDSGRVYNIRSLLKEIQLNKAFKGEGPLMAASCGISFGSAFSAVKAKQKKGAMFFGPFTIRGINCCRFVWRGILCGKPDCRYNWKLKLIFPFLPRPKTIVSILPNNVLLPERRKLREYKNFSSTFEGTVDTRLVYNKGNVKGVLPAPALPADLPEDCQWLSGEVSGSWFHILRAVDHYLITRYSPEGTLECSGIFSISAGQTFDIDSPFRITYLSHCNKVTIHQNNARIDFIGLSGQARTVT